MLPVAKLAQFACVKGDTLPSHSLLVFQDNAPIDVNYPTQSNTNDSPFATKTNLLRTSEQQLPIQNDNMLRRSFEQQNYPSNYTETPPRGLNSNFNPPPPPPTPPINDDIRTSTTPQQQLPTTSFNTRCTLRSHQFSNANGKSQHPLPSPINYAPPVVSRSRQT